MAGPGQCRVAADLISCYDRIKRGSADLHTLEYLLAFDGRIHWYEQGHFLKFQIRRTETTPERPHGLRYSFTLHGPDGTRLMGFDNAHGAVAKGSPFKARQTEADHWHRTEADPGRPYRFTDAATLVADFFEEVDRILTERGIPLTVIDTEPDEGGRP